MEIKLNINDCKKIANNVEKKYSEVEVCLARKMLAQEHVLSELKMENADLLGLVQGIYNRIACGKFGVRVAERRKNELAAQSKANFAAAVKLDNQLKGIINDGTCESKDSGGDGEA